MNINDRPPFQAKTQATLTSKIKAGKVADLPKQYSNELQRLIKLMFTIDHEKRPGTAMFLRNERISMTLREQDLNNAYNFTFPFINLSITDLKKKEDELNQRVAQLEISENFIKATEDKLKILENELVTREKALTMHENNIAAREQILTSREAQLLEKEAKIYNGNFLESPKIVDTTMHEVTIIGDSPCASPCIPKLTQRKSLAHLVAARAISETPRVRKPLIDSIENSRYILFNLS